MVNRNPKHITGKAELELALYWKPGILVTDLTQGKDLDKGLSDLILKTFSLEEYTTFYLYLDCTVQAKHTEPEHDCDGSIDYEDKDIDVDRVFIVLGKTNKPKQCISMLANKFKELYIDKIRELDWEWSE